MDNPAAKIIVEMARVQDEEVGDGTTSVAVFASELLRQAEKLIDMRIHPQTIIAGWRQATDVAKEALKTSVSLSSTHSCNSILTSFVDFRRLIFDPTR